MITSRKCVVLVFVLFFCLEIKAQLYLGDECYTEAGKSGVCSYLTKCQSAREEIKKGIYPTDICGYEGTQVIVCCVSTVTITTTTTKKPTAKPTVTQPVTVKPTPTKPVGNRPGDKANFMCNIYAQYAYEKVDSPALALETTFSKILECPIATQSLIVGGTKAGRKEFPHMIQLGYGSGGGLSWDCGGSLISESFILTAGHCMSHPSKGEAKLARGGISNQSDTLHLQTRNIIQRIKYPDYNYAKYNDIALMKVDRQFDLNTFLRPACLYTQATFPVTHGIATGWGLIDFAGDASQDLLKVTLEFFTTAQCNNTYRRIINQPNSDIYMGIVEDIMICAGSSVELKDTCQGDSGGPLQIIHEETKEIKCMYSVIGVTSFGIACGLAKSTPGVYTRVSYYVKWIEDLVWPKL